MNIQDISTEIIQPNPWQPRLAMDPAGILDSESDHTSSNAAQAFEALAKKLKVKAPIRDFWKSLAEATAEVEETEA